MKMLCRKLCVNMYCTSLQQKNSDILVAQWAEKWSNCGGWVPPNPTSRHLLITATVNPGAAVTIKELPPIKCRPVFYQLVFVFLGGTCVKLTHHPNSIWRKYIVQNVINLHKEIISYVNNSSRIIFYHWLSWCSTDGRNFVLINITLLRVPPWQPIKETI